MNNNLLGKSVLENILSHNPRQDVEEGCSLSVALMAAQEYAGKLGHVASFPEIAEARIYADKNNYIWNSRFTCATEEDIGVTKSGKLVFVVSHGEGILLNQKRLSRIEDSGDSSIINLAFAKLDDSEFFDLLDGKLPGCREIPIFSYDSFLKESALPKDYAVVLDLRTVAGLSDGWQKADLCKENQLVIARLGGVERAEVYIDTLKQVFLDTFKESVLYLSHTHDCRHLNLDFKQGRLVLAGVESYASLSGGDDFGPGHCFIGIKSF